VTPWKYSSGTSECPVSVQPVSFAAGALRAYTSSPMAEQARRAVIATVRMSFGRNAVLAFIGSSP